MTVQYHPDESTLTAFAAGTLDHGQHVAVATHLVSCPHCRAFVRSMEQVGGAVLADLPPVPMSSQALAAVTARLDEPPPRPAPAPEPADSEVPGLPRFVARYRFGRWKWIAPAVQLRPIALPYPSESRVFLLRSGPGRKLLQHSHSGTEMTCVLAGAFRQGGLRYGPGDFDFGDESIDHQPVTEPEGPCICLVALQGELRLDGLIGRMIQPFIRL